MCGEDNTVSLQVITSHNVVNIYIQRQQVCTTTSTSTSTTRKFVPSQAKVPTKLAQGVPRGRNDKVNQASSASEVQA